MARVAIRRMRDEDLDAVLDLAMLANPFAERTRYREYLESMLKEVPDLSFVAVLGREIVGFVQADMRDEKAILEDIAVAVEHQGRGVGARLLEVELEALRRLGVRRVRAEVHYKRAESVPFYYARGFRMVGVERDRFGLGEDAIIVERKLE